eukprot:4219202-Prorocentrum_lima.AAC.1
MTSWQTRSEAALRLLKHHAIIMFDHIKAYEKMEPHLSDASASEMIREAAGGRNLSVTYGGKTP